MKKSIRTALASFAVLAAAAGCQTESVSGIKNDPERDAIRKEIIERVNVYASDSANADTAYSDSEVEKYFKGVREVAQISTVNTLSYEYTDASGAKIVNGFKRPGKFFQSYTKDGKTETIAYVRGKAIRIAPDGTKSVIDSPATVEALRFIYDMTMNPLKMGASASMDTFKQDAYELNIKADKVVTENREVMVNGRMCNVINLTLKEVYDVPAVTYYVSVDDKSIVGKKYAPSKSNANSGVMITYSDFAENNGFYAPKKVVNKMGDKVNTLTLDSVKTGIEIPDEIFEISGLE